MRGVAIVLVLALVSPAWPADVVPVKKDAPAPFTGLLVPEERFTELLRAELQVQELKGKLSIQEKTTQALDTMYLRHLERATEPVPWYEKPSFNRWLGFGLGVVCTGLAVWGAVEFGKANK